MISDFFLWVCESRVEKKQSKVLWNCKNLDEICCLSVAPGRWEVSATISLTSNFRTWKLSPKVTQFHKSALKENPGPEG